MRQDPLTRDEPEDGTSVLVEEDLEPASERTRAGRPGYSYSSLDPRALLFGRSFGGFRVVSEIASGGMASVFLARKDGPGRVSQHAAIKIVHPHLACQSDFVDMFLDEARIVSCVHHPNVCRVLDFGTSEGTYYLAMEYVLGETWGALQSALAADETGRKILPTLAAFVIAQACEGLHAAHEAADDQGESLHIVHRDISPQNIFVAYDGTVRVLDFGIARAADRITTTQAGTVKGRLAYMAPEQMEGQTVDRRADLWSLGVVLREALENKRLFRRGSDAETMIAVTSDPIPPWVAPIPPKLQEVVERALERDPSRRYVTARQLGVDLMRFARGQAMPMDMPELSSWMHRLFRQKLEEKRLLLLEPAPETRSGSSTLGPAWPSAPPSGYTPSVEARGPQRSGEFSYSSTQAPIPEEAPRSKRAAAVALFALVASSAGAGVWFARHRGLGGPDFSETELAQAAQSAPQAGSTPTQAVPVAAKVAEQLPIDPSQAIAPGSPASGTAGARTAEAPDGANLADAPEEPPASSSRRHRDRTDKPTEEPELRPAVEATTAVPTVTKALPGTVLVACSGGWAEVFLGDKLLGTTPGRFNVPSGRQTLSIKAFGAGVPSQHVVDVPPGGSTKLLIKPEAP